MSSNNLNSLYFNNCSSTATNSSQKPHDDMKSTLLLSCRNKGERRGIQKKARRPKTLSNDTTTTNNNNNNSISSNSSKNPTLHSSIHKIQSTSFKIIQSTQNSLMGVFKKTNTKCSLASYETVWKMNGSSTNTDISIPNISSKHPATCSQSEPISVPTIIIGPIATSSPEPLLSTLKRKRSELSCSSLWSNSSSSSLDHPSNNSTTTTTTTTSSSLSTPTIYRELQQHHQTSAQQNFHNKVFLPQSPPPTHNLSSSNKTICQLYNNNNHKGRTRILSIRELLND